MFLRKLFERFNAKDAILFSMIVVFIFCLGYVEHIAEIETLKVRLSEGWQMLVLDSEGRIVVEPYQNNTDRFRSLEDYNNYVMKTYSNSALENYRFAEWPSRYQEVYLMVFMFLCIAVLIVLIRGFDYWQGQQRFKK